MDMKKSREKQPGAAAIFGRRSRRFPRRRVGKFSCQLADSKSIFKGSIDELSVQGFRISNVPPNFCDESKIYRAIFSEGKNYYKITVIPRWSKPSPGGNGCQAGYKILDNDWKWLRFSLDVLPAMAEHQL